MSDRVIMRLRSAEATRFARDEIRPGARLEWSQLVRSRASGRRPQGRGAARFLRAVAASERVARDLDDETLAREARRLREVLRRRGIARDSAALSFGLVRAAAERTIRQRHYDVQVLGGWTLLQGRIAEMETGEGKTLTATLAGGTAALAGISVHVITVNDYLARRDAEAMGPIYRALGLTVGVIVAGMEPAERRRAYACDVTYCTNKEIVFDYLRDCVASRRAASPLHEKVESLARGGAASRLIASGLQFAIVDEADSVLVDDAKTPLILSETVPNHREREVYSTAIDIARQLSEGSDYRVDRKLRSVVLTSRGSRRVERFVDAIPRGRRGIWMHRRQRSELIAQALAAVHLYERDKHYLVREDEIDIIDEYTGRTLPDRAWEHGLHQAIEAKEGCPLSSERQPIARLTYQRFFRRYTWLSGMTGTAQEVAGELAGVYDVVTVRVPTHQPVRRESRGVRVFRTAEEKWEAVVGRIQEMRERLRPVLVGTRFLSDSEHLSALLKAAAIPHQVLNANCHEDEAEIVARAGELERVTVATNMAGRGTDIRLPGDVVVRGGLHVIAADVNEARRIDRQLYGRGGRQGDPGTFEGIFSLEDELIRTYASGWARWLAAKAGRLGEPIHRLAGEWIVREAQTRCERHHRRIRRNMLQREGDLETTLAFAGAGE